MIRDVTDLEVYQESLRLLNNLYVFLRKIPRSEYDTVLQCKRCSKSIPANIAEGFAKRVSALEFKRFLKIAIGSSDEMISHFRMIIIVIPGLSREAKELSEEYKILSKRLNKLHSNWKSDNLKHWFTNILTYWYTDTLIHWVFWTALSFLNGISFIF